ncbi:nucleoporin complex subunit 54-domain-containing protein [Melampsora americana]|nr:nucleoporin complex subunit 54-domain-containing protein [Melampsora americana]
MSSSSLFGNNQQPQQSTSLFGNNQPTSNTTSLFGNNQTPANTSSLFGNNNNKQSSTSSLFGNTNNNNQTSNTSSLFGTNNTTPQNNTSSLFGNNSNSSLFGNNSNSSLFGNNHTQASSNSSLFNSNNQNQNQNNNPNQNQGSTLFNSSSSSLQPLLNSTSTSLIRSQPNLSNSIQTQIKHQVSIEEKILKIYKSWNLSDPDCEFHYFFYNLVQPDQIHLYQRPPLSQDEKKWELAKRSNPNPNRMVPVLAIGFNDLIKRQTAQVDQANLHLNQLIEFSNKLNQINQTLSLKTTSKLHKLITTQSILTNRLINLIRKLPLSTLVLEDFKKNEEYLNLINHVNLKFQKIGGQSKLAELWSILSFLKTSFAFNSLDSNGKLEGFGRWTITDDREIKKVLEVLRNQQLGIDHLMNVLRNDLEHYKFMANAFQIESN